MDIDKNRLEHIKANIIDILTSLESDENDYCSVGDLLEIEGEYYLITALGSTSSPMFCLTDIDSGKTWRGFEECDDWNFITIEEMNQHIGDYDWVNITKRG